MYRLLATQHGGVRERRAHLEHPTHARPQLLTEAPNEVHSWDITKLKGPLRVIRVIASLDPAVGGPAESSVNSCIAAQRAGVQTTALVPVTQQAMHRVEPVIQCLQHEGVRVHTFSLIPAHSYYSHRWAISPTLAAWLFRRLRQYDLVHVHAAWGLAQSCGLLAAVTLQRPCVITPHERSDLL